MRHQSVLGAGPFFACFLVLFLFSASAAALPAETWLVTIGNNRGDAGEEGLLYAERDAREFSDVLHSVSGVATPRTHLLLGENAEAVRRALLEVNAQLKHEGEQPPSALIVYYSGHADAQALHLEGSRLPFEELRLLLASSPASLRLLIVDSCRSGGASRVKGIRDGPAPNFRIDLENHTSVQGLVIITSSAATESSQESEILKGSFFSHHLMSALRGAADRDRDGQVTLTEAYSYTYEQTLRSTGRTLDLQHPTYSFDLKGRGDVVLSQPGRIDRAVARLRLGGSGLYLISEGQKDGPLFAEVTSPHPETLIALPARRYFIQHRVLSEFREYEVMLTTGAEASLTAQPYRSVAYDRLVRRRGTRLRSVHGLGVLGGLRGETVVGEGPTGQLMVRYGADLPWLSLETRLRLSSTANDGEDGQSPRRHSEVGLGFVIQRYVDLSYLSVAFGLWIEGTLHIQNIGPLREAPDRRSIGMMFGGFLAVERQIYRGLSLRLEGGPLAPLFLQSRSSFGAEIGIETKSLLTYWIAGGLLWRL